MAKAQWFFLAGFFAWRCPGGDSRQNTTFASALLGHAQGPGSPCKSLSKKQKRGGVSALGILLRIQTPIKHSVMRVAGDRQNSQVRFVCRHRADPNSRNSFSEAGLLTSVMLNLMPVCSHPGRQKFRSVPPKQTCPTTSESHLQMRCQAPLELALKGPTPHEVSDS